MLPVNVISANFCHDGVRVCVNCHNMSRSWVMFGLSSVKSDSRFLFICPPRLPWNNIKLYFNLRAYNAAHKSLIEKTSPHQFHGCIPQSCWKACAVSLNYHSFILELHFRFVSWLTRSVSCPRLLCPMSPPKVEQGGFVSRRESPQLCRPLKADTKSMWRRERESEAAKREKWADRLWVSITLGADGGGGQGWWGQSRGVSATAPVK